MTETRNEKATQADLSSKIIKGWQMDPTIREKFATLGGVYVLSEEAKAWLENSIALRDYEAFMYIQKILERMDQLDAKIDVLIAQSSFPSKTKSKEEKGGLQDILANFIKSCCFLAPKAKVKASILYSRFSEWHKANIGGEIPSSTAFGRGMARRFDKRKSGCVRYWGIGLLPRE